jgi:hypothetical protein
MGSRIFVNPTFVAATPTAGKWQADGSGYIYIFDSSQANTLSVQAFAGSGESGDVKIKISNSKEVDSFQIALDQDDAEIAASVAADSNEILFSNDISRTEFTGIYVENVVGGLVFKTSMK